MADGTSYTLKGFDEYEVVLGDQLRGERATMGKSLLDVQRDLKIKAAYIAAIENCDLDVFSDRGFTAGYVKSYARYLNLDPEIVFAQFCNESGFSSGGTELNFQISKRESSNVPKKFGPVSNWKPGEIVRSSEKNSSLSTIFLNSLPLIALLFVIIGTSFGALSILKEVQKIDIVALEEAPDEFVDLSIENSVNSILNTASNIYSSEELELPVFEPRDKAVSRIDPGVLSALVDLELNQPIKYSAGVTPGISKPIKEPNLVKSARPDPVVRTVPNIPQLELLALTPAWVRLKNVDGDVILEKTLKSRETFLIEKELFSGELRAGNAQNVYFIIDKEIFGPLSKAKSVVKKVSLDPEVIKQNWELSTEAMVSFFGEFIDTVPLNTADNSE